MKSRKFEIEWQLYKSYFKYRMSLDPMEGKMALAHDVYTYFADNRSKELAYNVVNWLDGLVIAFRPTDDRREVIENKIVEVKSHWSTGSFKTTVEPDDSFGRDAIMSFIGNPSPFYRAHISSTFDQRLLMENLTQNLDMLNKWLKKHYVHEDGLEYVADCISVCEELGFSIPSTVTKRWDKARAAYEYTVEENLPSTHKFLY